MDDDRIVTRQSYARRSKSPSRKVTPRGKAVRESYSETVVESSVPSVASMTFPTIDTPRHLYGLDSARSPHAYKANKNLSSYYERKVTHNASSSNGDCQNDYPDSRHKDQRWSEENSVLVRMASFCYRCLNWLWIIFRRNAWLLVAVILFLVFGYLLILLVQHVVLAMQNNFYNKPPIVKEKVAPPPTVAPSPAEYTNKELLSAEWKRLEKAMEEIQHLTVTSNNLRVQLEKSNAKLTAMSSRLVEHENSMLQLNEKFKIALSSIDEKVENIIAGSSCARSGAKADVSSKFDQRETLKKLIEHHLAVYDADKLGRPDYASEAFGARIHSPFYTETYSHAGSAIIEVFVHTLWKDKHTPRTMIQSGNEPGSCWSMKGSSGYVVIELAMPVVPSEFILEHLSPLLQPPHTEMFQSTPKDFEIYAWFDDDGEERVKLGTYSYNRNGKALQIFPVQFKVNAPVRLIELRILSNYGNRSYTCIYRLRVHGDSTAASQS